MLRILVIILLVNFIQALAMPNKKEILDSLVNRDLVKLEGFLNDIKSQEFTKLALRDAILCKLQDYKSSKDYPSLNSQVAEINASQKNIGTSATKIIKDMREESTKMQQ